MFPFILALFTALSESFKDLVSKVSLKRIDEYILAWSTHVIQVLILLPVLLFSGLESMSSQFLLVLFSSSVIQFTVVLLYLKALKSSEISLVVPLITLTPLFMLISSPIMIGEFPNMFGLIGIVLIVSGTYVLNISPKGNFWSPFQSILKNKGSRYMVIVAFLWSITANLDKVGVEETSPIFWAFSKDFVLMFFLLPVMIWKSPKPGTQIKKQLKSLLAIGFFRATSVVTQMIAIQFILVSYVIAIKRSSALFIILWGFLFLKEREYFKARIGGVIIILSGICFIIFGK